jgi:nicotinamidase-related amidase
MFKTIQNPETGKWVDPRGRIGQKILSNYVRHVGGGAANSRSHSKRGRALIVIDVQNCFLPGGSLATIDSDDPYGKNLISNINKLINKKTNKRTHFYDKVYFTFDSHPEGHISFPRSGESPFNARKNSYKSENVVRKWTSDTDVTTQAIWPKHCQSSGKSRDKGPGRRYGSSLAPGLKHHKVDNKRIYYVNKGTNKNVDSYSAIADALGNPTPKLRHNDVHLLCELKNQNFREIAVCGIARNVCVFWTFMDLLEFLPAANSGQTTIDFKYKESRSVNDKDPGMHIKDATLRQKVKKHFPKSNVKIDGKSVH